VVGLLWNVTPIFVSIVHLYQLLPSLVKIIDLSSYSDPAKCSRMAFKLLHKSAAIRLSTKATGKYGLGLTSTAYVNLMALSPGGEQPGSGCIRHTP